MLAMYTVYLQHFSYSCLTTSGGESTRFAPRLLAFSIPILACIQSSVRVLSYSFSKHCRAVGALLLLVFNLLFFDANAITQTCAQSPHPCTMFTQTCALSTHPCTMFTQTCALSTHPCTMFTQPCALSPHPCVMFTQTCALSPQPCAMITQTRALSPHPCVMLTQTCALSPQPCAMFAQPCVMSSQTKMMCWFFSINKTRFTSMQMHTFVGCLLSQRYKLPRPFV